MLRTDIMRGLASVLAAVEESNALDVVERVYRDLTRQTGEVGVTEVLESYQKFLLAYNSRFGATEKQLMKTLEVHEFAEAGWWSNVIGAAGGAGKTQEAASAIGHPLYRLRFAADYLPQVIALMKRDTDPDIAALKADAQLGTDRPGQLLLILPEDGTKFSSPARITAAIDSIALLYEGFAELGVHTTTDLVVKSCDSGTDKVFEFQGVVDLIAKVKELLLDIWDNVIYYREKKFTERLELTAKNLPILAEIAALEGKNQLQKERAELLRRKFNAGATKFFETGSSIPEMMRHATYVPRQLLSPKETLLLAGAKSA